jgi:hypothetical protein
MSSIFHDLHDPTRRFFVLHEEVDGHQVKDASALHDLFSHHIDQFAPKNSHGENLNCQEQEKQNLQNLLIYTGETRITLG